MKTIVDDWLERAISLAERSMTIQCSWRMKVKCWTLLQERALEYNNEEWFNKASNVLSILKQFA